MASVQLLERPANDRESGFAVTTSAPFQGGEHHRAGSRNTAATSTISVIFAGPIQSLPSHLTGSGFRGCIGPSEKTRQSHTTSTRPGKENLS